MSATAGAQKQVAQFLFGDTTPSGGNCAGGVCADMALASTFNLGGPVPLEDQVAIVEGYPNYWIFEWTTSGSSFNTDGTPGAHLAYQASTGGDVLWTATGGSNPQVWDAVVIAPPGPYQWSQPLMKNGQPADLPAGFFPNGVQSLTIGQVYGSDAATGDPGPWIVGTNACSGSPGNSNVFLLEEIDVGERQWFQMPGCLYQIAEDSSASDEGELVQGENIYGAAFDADGNTDLWAMPLSPRNGFGVPTGKWTKLGQILPTHNPILSMAAVSGQGIFFTTSGQGGLCKITDIHNPGSFTCIVALNSPIQPRSVSRDYWNFEPVLFLGEGSANGTYFVNGVWSIVTQ
jgi:hypothetical protein